MSKLKISDDLSLPLDAVTQTIAILARKRVGKTYTASVIAEEFIEAKIPIVVLDPTGAWWGLRSSADGKHEGYPVIIIGGGHADVPLEETAGKVIADLVVDHPGFYIIDFSQIESDAACQRFATDFAKRFYFRKEQNRFAVHMFIDEADVFIPQNPFGEEKRMLHAFDVIVRRGGIRGIGCTMITQRPAVLNKNVLTQCETLIALQISGSQDVDAIEHWMRVHGTKEQKSEFLSTIGSLQMGVAWFWSPSWLQKFERIHIRERRTFNSSATPKAGEKTVIPPKLAAIDIEKLGKEIKATVERIQANDPKELKRQIASLQKQVDAKPAPVVQKTETKTVEKFALKEGQLARAEKLADRIVELQQQLAASIAEIASAVKLTRQPAPQSSARPPVRPAPIPQRRAAPTTTQVEGDLSGPEQRIINSIGWLESIGVVDPEQTAVAFLAGYTHGGGGFNNPRGALRTKGLVDYVGGNKIGLTDAGRALAQIPDEPLTTEELHQKVLSVLPRPEQRILKPLLEAWPAVLSNEQLAELSGYTNGSGGYNNPRGRLRSLGLIEYVQGGVSAREILFLNGDK